MEEILKNLSSYLLRLKIRIFFNLLVFTLTIIISIIYYKHFHIFFLTKFYWFYPVILLFAFFIKKIRSKAIIFHELLIPLILIILIFLGNDLDNLSKAKLSNTITITTNILIKYSFFSVLSYSIFFLGYIGFLNDDWKNFFQEEFKKNAKKIINASNIENIDIKYNIEVIESKNISIENPLLNFLNYLILVNTTDNFNKAINYINKNTEHNKDFKLEDEIIIKINNNLTIEAIKIFLKDKYIKRKYGEAGVFDIINFEGFIISTDLKNIYEKLPENKKPILIYKSNLFENPLNIKYINSNDLLLTNEKNISNILPNIENINSLGYQVLTIAHRIYCLYHLEDKNNINLLENILKKAMEKLYIKNNYKKSFILFYQGILYLFISHEDNIFNSKNIFDPPPYLTLNSKKIEEAVNNIKNNFEIILELTL